MTEPEKKFRLLIVDDNPNIHDDFKNMLATPTINTELDAFEESLFGEANSEPASSQPKYEIDSAYQGQEGADKVALAIQRSRPYSMAFVDMRMPPGIDGIETIERMWKAQPSLQVVICTAYSDYSWHETIEKLGCTDRLLILKKPFDRMEACQLALALCVKSEFEALAKLKSDELSDLVLQRTADLEAEIKRRQHVEALLLAERSKLEIKATIDSVTGLQNRGAVTERIETLADQAIKLGFEFSILFIDVDHFKKVNDKYGHAAGDAVLREVAERLKAGLRASDTIGRYGGEEFVMGLLKCNAKYAMMVGERLIESISSTPIQFEDQLISVTVSIGTASDSIRDQGETKRLIEEADQALYQAKSKGRNRVEQYV